MASLLVPLGLWRPSLAAALDVSCVGTDCVADDCYVADEHPLPPNDRPQSLFLGLRHGAVLVFDLACQELRTSLLLCGHATPIVALASARQPTDQPDADALARDARVLVSLAAGGDVALWALDEDGRCLLHNTMACGPGGDARGMVLAGAFAVVWGGSPASPIVSVLRLATLEIASQAVLSPPAVSAVPPAENILAERAPGDHGHSLSIAALPHAEPMGLDEGERPQAIKKSASLDASAMAIRKSVAAADISRPPSTASEAEASSDSQAPLSTPRPSRIPSVVALSRSMRPETAAAAGALVCTGVWLPSCNSALLFAPGAAHVVAVEPTTGAIVGVPRSHALVDDACAAIHVRHACVSAHGVLWAADARVLYAVDIDAGQPHGPPTLRAVWRAPSPIAQLTGGHVRLCNGAVYALPVLSADAPADEMDAPVVASLAALFVHAPVFSDVALTALGAVCYDARHVRLCALPARPLDGSAPATHVAAVDKQGITGITCTAVWERGSDGRLVHGMADGAIVVRPLLDAACVPTDTLSAATSASSSPADPPSHAWSLALPSSTLLPSSEASVQSSLREIAHIDAPQYRGSNAPIYVGSNASHFSGSNAPHYRGDNAPQFGGDNAPQFGGDNAPQFGGANASPSHRLSVVDCRGEEVALPHVHRRAVTALAVDTRGRLASGDAAGAVVLWALHPRPFDAGGALHGAPAAVFEPRHTFHVHAAPIVALVAVRTAAPSISGPQEGAAPAEPPQAAAHGQAHVATHVVVDADGAVSFVQEDVVLGVVPARSGRPPVVLVRWTLDRRVALFYRDGVVRVWSLATLTAHDVPGGAREELAAFAFYQEVPAHPAYAAGMGAVHASAVVCNGLLGQALVWRTDAASSGACGLRDARVQAAMLDVRRVIETLRSRIVDRASDAARAHVSNTLLAVLGVLLPWGADAALDAAARDAGVRPPGADVCVAMVGANGNTAYGHGRVRSATMDATLRIACASVLAVPLDVGPQWAALARVLLDGRPAPAPPSADVSVVPAPIAVRFPLGGSGEALRVATERSQVAASGSAQCVRIGGALPWAERLPSLSFASKYGHDLCDEIRTAARAVLADALARMHPRVLDRVVAYWADLLPVDETPKTDLSDGAPMTGLSDGAQNADVKGAPNADVKGAQNAAVSGRRKMNRAAVILGIVALQRGEALPAPLRRRVADSLLVLLTDERRNLFRSAAIELIGRGYADVWAPHIDAPPVFRLLHTWLASVTHVVGARPHGEAHRASVSTSLGLYEASVGGEASVHALTVSGIGRRALQPHPADGEAVQLVVPFESEAAVATLEAVRTTLVHLGRDAPRRVLVPWVGCPEYAGSRTLVERWTGASLLAEMLRAPDAPVRFAGLALLFVEAALRLLDTGAASGLAGPVAATRARLLASALPLVAETCRVFPTVCYDPVAQRLLASADAPALDACELPDCRIRVYDLRTAGGGASPSVFPGHPPLAVDCRVLDGHTRPATALCAVGADTGAWLAEPALLTTPGGAPLTTPEGAQGTGADAPRPHARTPSRLPPPYASVVTYSYGEATLRWWHVSSSASSAGSSAVPPNAPPGSGPAGGRLVATDVVDPALTEAVVRHAGEEGLPVGFRWHPDRVQILVGARVVCTARIPPQ